LPSVNFGLQQAASEEHAIPPHPTGEGTVTVSLYVALILTQVTWYWSIIIVTVGTPTAFVLIENMMRIRIAKKKGTLAKNIFFPFSLFIVIYITH
jgi:hypothetical protein